MPNRDPTPEEIASETARVQGLISETQGRLARGENPLEPQPRKVESPAVDPNAPPIDGVQPNKITVHTVDQTRGDRLPMPLPGQLESAVADQQKLGATPAMLDLLHGRTAPTQEQIELARAWRSRHLNDRKWIEAYEAGDAGAVQDKLAVDYVLMFDQPK